MNYLFAKLLEILTTGLLEIGKFVRKTSFDLGKSENYWVLCNVTFSNIPLL